jgi:integrase
MNLTTTTVRALAIPPGKTEAIFFDATVPGFGIRIREGGSRNFVFQYAIGTKHRRLTLGKFPALSVADARRTASTLYAKVKLGEDPAGEKADKQARAGETFGAVLKTYLAQRQETARRQTTYSEIERHLARNLLPLHSLHIAKVDLRAVSVELDRVTREHGAVQSNRTRASLSKFFNWCAGRGIVAANPAAFANRNEEHPRERVLTAAELKAIWQASPDNDYGAIIKILALTGCRAREVSGLRWSEVDLDGRLWTLPGERTKNHRSHLIPLAEPAYTIITQRPRRIMANGQPRDLIFGAGEGPFSGWSNSKEALDKRILEMTGHSLASWVVHDLRRAFSTMLHDDLGIPPHVVERLLNHISGHQGGVAGRYNKAEYLNEKKQALARWGEHLLALVERYDGSIVPLRAAPR